MQYDVDVVARLPARRGIGDVAFDQHVALPRGRRHGALDFGEVAPVAGREIVQRHDVLVELEQRLHEMRTDEAGAARDQPASRSGSQPILRGADGRVRTRNGVHQRRHTVTPRARSESASTWHFTSTNSPPVSSFAR